VWSRRGGNGLAELTAGNGSSIDLGFYLWISSYFLSLFLSSEAVKIYGVIKIVEELDEIDMSRNSKKI